MAKNAFGPKWSINDANYLAPKALGEIVGISFSPTLEGEEGAGPEGSYLLLLIFCSNACLPPPPPAGSCHQMTVSPPPSYLCTTTQT